MSEKEKLEDIKEEICNATAQWKLLLQRITSQVKKKILEVIPSMEFTKSSKHQHINVVFLFFFSTLDSIFLDFKDAEDA